MKELQIAKPLYLQVYASLKESIFDGEMKPGGKLNVLQLAETFQISRTPLREALRQLESEGLVTQKGQSFYVVKLNAEDFKELYECRFILEREIIEMAIEKITDEEIEDISKVFDKSTKALDEGDYLSFMELNTLFHDKILSPCPNQRLITLLHQVKSLLLIYRVNIINHNDNSRLINEEHKLILLSLQSKNIHKLIENLDKHLQNDLIRGLSIINNST